MKAVTPIVSIIILLLITIALAGVAYTYLSCDYGFKMSYCFLEPVGVQVIEAQPHRDGLRAEGWTGECLEERAVKKSRCEEDIIRINLDGECPDYEEWMNRTGRIWYFDEITIMDFEFWVAFVEDVQVCTNTTTGFECVTRRKDTAKQCRYTICGNIIIEYECAKWHLVKVMG